MIIIKTTVEFTHVADVFLNLQGKRLQYVVGDLFPTGPISGIFALLASISRDYDFSSKIDF